jgi:hypothetical protein
MKLLNCTACQDIVRLFPERRSCQCGRSSGQYTNLRHVTFSGPGRILGLKSLDYHRAQLGREYTWWLIPEGESVTKTGQP